jgi:predicted Rossmann fold nucleotide-binding protein DprA/Smf involved in DNA uptake
MMNKVVKANTGTLTIPSSATATTGTVTLSMSIPGQAPKRRVESKRIESAVYAHIQAVRALGRTQIEPQEIARALGLSVQQVQSTVQALKQKGVKQVHV